MTNRRIFILNGCAGLAAATLGCMAWAENRVALKEDEPLAKEFNYVIDAAKVDGHKFPDFKAGDRCSKCQIYEDGANDMGGCAIFPGKLVAAGGWCSSFG